MSIENMKIASADADSSGATGGLVRSPLVGRERELRAVMDALSRAKEFSVPELVTVIGNQGTGKSRFAGELRTRAAEMGARVFFGKAVPDGARFHVLKSLLRDRFEIKDGDTEDKIKANFTREVKRVFEDERVSDVLHFLGSFLDLSFPNSVFVNVLSGDLDQYGEISRTILRRFLEADGKKGPVLWVVDDLHWADDDSLELLSNIGASTSGSPVVVVACARPEIASRFSGWESNGSQHTRVELRNLSDGDAGVMFRRLLSRCNEVPDNIVSDAVSMTGGNPYFLEQLVRLFLVNGTVDGSKEEWVLDSKRAFETELPISVEEAIEARIAALALEERQLLEKASVFGNVFWLGAVIALERQENAEVSELLTPMSYDWTDTNEPVRQRVVDLLETLVERDYVLELPLGASSVDGDVEYIFKHNLERDLVFKSTSASQKQQYLRRAADWFSLTTSLDTADQYEYVAQMYEHGSAAGPAGQAYLLGADRAYDRYNYDVAARLYEKALEFVESLMQREQLHALHNMGASLDVLGKTSEAEKAFNKMLHFAWLFEHHAKAGAAYSRLGRVKRRLGDYASATQLLGAAHELFARAGDSRGVAGTMDDVGQIYWLEGNAERAVEYQRQALGVRQSLGDERSVALSFGNLARSYYAAGQFGQAWSNFVEALALRRKIGDLQGVVQSLSDLGRILVACMDAENAEKYLSEARKIAEETENNLAMVEIYAGLGDAKALASSIEDAESFYERALALTEKIGDQRGRSSVHRRLAELLLYSGNVRAAEECAIQALSDAEKISSNVLTGNARRVAAEIAAVQEQAGTKSRLGSALENYMEAERHLSTFERAADNAKLYLSYGAYLCKGSDVENGQSYVQRGEEIVSKLRAALVPEQGLAQNLHE